MNLRETFKTRVFNNRNGLKNLYALVYKLFNVRLTYYQIITLKDLLDELKRNIVVSYARQAGKTEVLAVFMALVPIFFDDIKVLVFGPKIEQAQISFNRAVNLIKNNKLNVYDGCITVDKADRLGFSNGVLIRAVSASINAEIEGLTAHVILIDECQNVSSFKISEAILPMGGATNAKIIASGVPRAKGTYFHKIWKDSNFILHKFPWRKCLRPKGVLYKDYVVKRMEDPESFRTQYELEWTDLQSQFVDIEVWDACESTIVKHLNEQEKIIESVYDLDMIKGDFLGIDFAKQYDSTVITEGIYIPASDDIFVTNWWELKGCAYNEQVGFITDLYNERQYQWILADKSAVGDAVIDFMDEKGLPVEGIPFDLIHKDRLYKDLRSSLLQKKIHWPKRENIKKKRNQILYKRFIQQCKDLEVKYRSSGLISVNAPDVSNSHDDYPDSLALLNRCIRNFTPPTAYFG